MIPGIGSDGVGSEVGKTFQRRMERAGDFKMLNTIIIGARKVGR